MITSNSFIRTGGGMLHLKNAVLQGISDRRTRYVMSQGVRQTSFRQPMYNPAGMMPFNMFPGMMPGMPYGQQFQHNRMMNMRPVPRSVIPGQLGALSLISRTMPVTSPLCFFSKALTRLSWLFSLTLHLLPMRRSRLPLMRC
jgi:hypothetical protein